MKKKRRAVNDHFYFNNNDHKEISVNPIYFCSSKKVVVQNVIVK